MKKSKLILLALVTISFIKCHSQTEKINYPETKKVVTEKTYHGVKITDSYSWLDKIDTKETQDWAQQQDQLMKKYVSDQPYYELIKEKVKGLMQYSGSTQLPVIANNKYYYLKNNEEGKWNLYFQEEGKEPIVFGEKEGLAPQRVLFYNPSPDGNFVALGALLERGYIDWLVYDLKLKKFHDNTLIGPQFGKVAFAWHPESKGFYYNTLTGKNDKGVRNNLVIKYYKISLKKSDDLEVFKPNSDGAKLEMNVSNDNQYLLITEREGAATAAKVYFGKLDMDKPDIKNLINNTDNSFIFLGNKKDKFYFETDWNATKGQIIEVNLKKPSEDNWKVHIEESNEAIMGYQSAGGTILPVMAGGNFVVPYLENLEQKLKVFDIKGKLLNEVKLPSGELYFNRNGSNAMSSQYDKPEVLLKFIGITEPETVFKINTLTSKVERMSKANTQFDPEYYTSEVVYCKSKDGTKVPITLTYKKGLVKDGSNYLMMQVYGAIAFTNYPYFQGDYITWLEMGGIHAVAHIRGGGALGSGWHQSGIKRNKQNGIDDYIATLKYVSDQKFTSAEKIVVNGVSAGTITVGAVLTQKPELIGAAVMHYSMLDMISYAEKYGKDQSHAYMVPELGNAADKDDFKVLNSYSPYQKISGNECYPPVLALTSEIDKPLNSESYKFIAKLQNGISSCRNPYLLQMAWGSGHSMFGSQNHSPALTFADEIAYLVKVLNIDISDWVKQKQ